MFNIIQFIEKQLNAIGVLDTSSNKIFEKSLSPKHTIRMEALRPRKQLIFLSV